jgi:hypothetical protein
MSEVAERREPVIHFVGEQDGAVERELKTKLSELFATRQQVQRAYLVRVRYGNEPAINVALALIASAQQEELVAEVGQLFHSMFGIGQHLDVMFASPAQETRISAVCRQFFREARVPGSARKWLRWL